jgi:hypothetical protein
MRIAPIVTFSGGFVTTVAANRATRPILTQSGRWRSTKLSALLTTCARGIVPTRRCCDMDLCFPATYGNGWMPDN